MKQLRLSFLLVLFLTPCVSAQWVKQEVATDASFRGLSVVNAEVVWASGSKGTFIRTTDGGVHWQVGTVLGGETLDFRDVEAFDANTAYLMAAGPGEASRIYKTTDGGKNWTLQHQNREPNAFFDSIAFRDSLHGMVLSDPVDGRFLLLRTDDGGKNWTPLPIEQRPKANDGEAAFAASGTCLVTKGKKDVWIATGGSVARVLHSTDRGKTWSVAETFLLHGPPSAGIFSLAFAENHDLGVAVGGDYQKPNDNERVYAATSTGGKVWNFKFSSASKDIPGTRAQPGLAITGRPAGFRSGLAYVPGSRGRTWIAVGTNGSDISRDGGMTWEPIDRENYNSVAFADEKTGWAVGPQGRVAKYSPGK